MKKDHSALKNRICHYSLLLLLLSGFSVGGLVTLNCTGRATNNAYTVKKADGVKAGKDGGVVFTKDKNATPTAEVTVPETIYQNGVSDEVVWVCDTVFDKSENKWRQEQFTGTVTVYHVRTNDQKFNENTILCKSFWVGDTMKLVPVTTINIPVRYQPETG